MSNTTYMYIVRVANSPENLFYEDENHGMVHAEFGDANDALDFMVTCKKVGLIPVLELLPMGD